MRGGHYRKVISGNMLPGWLRKAVRVISFLKSLGPIKWVVDVVGVVVCCVYLLLLVRVAFERPK